MATPLRTQSSCAGLYVPLTPCGLATKRMIEETQRLTRRTAYNSSRRCAETMRRESSLNSSAEAQSQAERHDMVWPDMTDGHHRIELPPTTHSKLWKSDWHNLGQACPGVPRSQNEYASMATTSTHDEARHA